MTMNATDTLPLPTVSPQAQRLLDEARLAATTSGELVRLIMSGTRRIESWLIVERILPALLAEGLGRLDFAADGTGRTKRQAAIVPLPDGSAFACSTGERWQALDADEALASIAYLGMRYAPDNQWVSGFTAALQRGTGEAQAVLPFAVADYWEAVTGVRPTGFTSGRFDEMGSLGSRLAGRVFNVQGRLGL